MSDSEKEPLRNRRPFSTIRKDSSVEDDFVLYRKRTSSLVPLTSSPFVEKPPGPTPPEKTKKPDSNALVVYVSEIPWSDLLLEIAMTTAFANLTDGTPIREASDVVSYLSFFAMVWWVWASQVAYNVRFRQSDWLHRLFVFLQLLVFCALAAFTKDFDVAGGMMENVQDIKKIEALQVTETNSANDIAVANFRNQRLPTLNARGISMTMALSRIVLLMQYIITFYYVPKQNHSYRTPFMIHIGTLVFSSVCYFVAYGLLGSDPSNSDQILKICLWYAPIIIEGFCHFVAASIPGRVRYPSEAIYARSSTVFIIILGGGLDTITGGFQYVVGNVSIGLGGMGTVFCAAVIFILIFTLYFGSSESHDHVGSRRALGQFFFQFFYLSALILTLQGIASMLTIANISKALETPFSFVTESRHLLENKGFGVYLNQSDYTDDFVHPLNKTGISLITLLDFINSGIDWAVYENDTSLPYNYVLQADIYVIDAVLRNFDSLPDDDSLLMQQMNTFYDVDAGNYTYANNETFNEIIQGIVVSTAMPAMWFFGAGGGVLLTLALMNLITCWPRDRWEWGQTISRLILGSLIVSMTAFNVHASGNMVNIENDFKWEGSRIWYLASHLWILPPYALALLVEQLIELVLLYMAGRNYGSGGVNAVFWHKVPQVQPYIPSRSSTLTGDVDILEYHPEHQPMYDPYQPANDKHNYLSSPPSSMTAADRDYFNISYQGEKDITGYPRRT